MALAGAGLALLVAAAAPVHGAKAAGWRALNNRGQYAFKFMEDFAAPDQSVVLGAGFAAVSCLGMVLLAFGMPSALTKPPNNRLRPTAASAILSRRG